MNSTTPLSRKLLIAGTSALLATLTAVSVCAFLAQTFGEKADLLASIASERLRETALIRLKKDLATALPEQEKLDHAFVSKDEVPAFLESVERTATDDHLEIHVDNLMLGKIGDRQVLSVDATISGTLRNDTAFIKALENEPYVISLGTTDIRAKVETSSVWEGKVSFVLQSYEN